MDSTGHEPGLLSNRETLGVMEQANQPCFICGSEQSEVGFLPNVQRWGQVETFVLRRCCECGLVFNSPRLSRERLHDLYRRNYYFFARPAGVEFERIQGAYLRTMAHLPATPGTLLEVGSAKGYMLALLAGLGWRVTGVEIAQTAADFSRRAFGVEVCTGTLEEFRRQDSRVFDVVLAQDVLEHVPEPGALLRSLHQSLRPGGWLVVDTPNVGGINVGVVGERWRGFNPFHIYLFQQSTLTQALSRAGFTVRLIGTYNQGSPEASVAGAAERPARLPASVRRGRAALRRVVDRVLRTFYLRRAIRQVLAGRPAPLDPQCRGDNLVCIAVRDMEHGTS